MPGLFDALTIDFAKLEADKKRIATAILKASRAAVEETTREAEKALEAATRAVRPGKLWRAWTSQVYPEKGTLAKSPAGVIRLNGKRFNDNGRISRTYGAIDFITTTGRIKNTRARYLAIPLPAAGSRGRLRDLTPEEWERRTGIKLRFVPGNGSRKPMLVADDAILSGKARIARGNTARRLKAGRGNATVPIFILMPSVAYDQKFSVETIVRPFHGRLVSRFTDEVARISTP